VIGQEYANVSAQGLVEFGSRIGVLSHPDRVVAAWTDTRNSRGGTTGQDIFATVVELPAEGGQPGWARALGGVMVAAGLACLVLALTALRRRRPATADD
jgi:hypothetical protein